MSTISYPGSATLADLCRNMAADQADGNQKLVSLEPIVNETSGGAKVNLNQATYAPADILDILDDLNCIDVSTVAGNGQAAEAGHTYTFIWRGKIFVQDKLTEVQVLGKSTT
jgi:hypothetical protein